MPDEETHIHGSMFFLLREFIVDNYGQETWLKLTKKAGTGSSYDPHKK